MGEHLDALLESYRRYVERYGEATTGTAQAQRRALMRLDESNPHNMYSPKSKELVQGGADD